jgi:glutathione synthase
MKKSFLWITDPWSTLDHPLDTTLRLAQETLAQGHSSYWCDVRSIRAEGEKIRLDAAPIRAIGAKRRESDFKLGPLKSHAPTDFDQLHYRVDPPVDLAYLHPLQILLLGLPGRASGRLVNPGAVLLAANEKIEAGPLAPPSLASSEWEQLAKFGRAEKKTVLKPLHQAQSKGIELLDWLKDPKRAHKLLAQATDEFTRPALLQRYLPGIAQGEQRLWFLDGQLLAFVRKLPLQGDFRVNLDQGSRVTRTKLSKSEQATAARIGRQLRTRGIRLAAVDLIENQVTDFNFTSPGLIVQMEAVLGEDLAGPLVRALARGAPRARSAEARR